jgi:hypothetical protein
MNPTVTVLATGVRNANVSNAVNQQTAVTFLDCVSRDHEIRLENLGTTWEQLVPNTG